MLQEDEDIMNMSPKSKVLKCVCLANLQSCFSSWRFQLFCPVVLKQSLKKKIEVGGRGNWSYTITLQIAIYKSSQIFRAIHSIIFGLQTYPHISGS